MLQPSQLEDVSVRYADEIGEVREFFATAGVAVGTPKALEQVAAWVREDRAFHRDLTSHVWVMLHRRGSAVRYGETLGILAIAAAGKQLAAQADEVVAHHLLRFVMEAHDRLNPPVRTATPVELKPVAPVIPMRPVREVVDPPVIQPEPVADIAASVEPEPIADPTVAPHHASMTSRMLVPTLVRSAPPAAEAVEVSAGAAMDAPIRPSRVDVAEEPQQRSRGLVWLALVVVLLCAVAVGWWMHRKPADEAEATPAPVVNGTPAAPAEQTPAVVVAPEQPVVTAPAAKPSGIPESARHAHEVAPSHARPQPYRPELVPSYPQPSAVAKTVPPPASPAPSAAYTRPPATTASAPPTTAAPIVRSAAPDAKAGPTTVPSNTLSKQLDRPGLTKEQEAEYDATGRRYPRLLRRTPSGATQIAANTVPTLPGGMNRSGSAGTAAIAGVVHPTSLGIMAGNVLYSPAAAYPQAASASHVSGAVKLEAVVDTTGNVVNARVISGPPQLRDAALSAIQQWRYRPYVLGGKARMFTTQALMEFELP